MTEKRETAHENCSFLGSKERDIESGLDFSQSRYYANPQGRFISVDSFDPILGKQGADDVEAAERELSSYLSQPQHWNRYIYALNNPLRYIDPDGLTPITVNLHIIYDKNSKYTEEEKKKIREYYLAEAKKAFGKIEVTFNITEDTGSAAIKKGEIQSGRKEGAFNVFFTKSYLVNSSPEFTPVGSSATFVRTHANNSNPRDLIHGLVHGFGIATGLNGYSWYGAAEFANELTMARFAFNLGISYSDDRSSKTELVPGWRTAKVEPVYRTVPYSITVYDTLRDGARKYQSNGR